VSQVVSHHFGALRVECLEPPPESGLPAIRILSTDFDWQEHCWLSVFVVIGFGGAHLSVTDGAGARHTFPEGTAHFLEHLVFWSNLHSRLIPIDKKFHSSPNAVVTHNQTVWYVTGVILPVTDRLENAVALVKGLLDVVRASPPAAEVDDAFLKRVRSDIHAEISDRSGDLERLEAIQLLGSLYPDSPIGHDMLGTEESLEKITSEDVHLALAVLRANVVSIDLIGTHLPADLMQRVTEIAHMPLDRPHPQVVPMEPSSSSGLTGRGSGFPSCRKDGRALVGLSLPPLRRGREFRSDMRRFLIEEFCCLGQLAGAESYAPSRISWPHARAFFGASDCDPLFFIDPQQRAEVIAAVCAKIIGAPHRVGTSRGFERMLEMSFLNLRDDWDRMLKLITAADLFGWPATDMLETWQLLNTQDCEELQAELEAAVPRACLMYASPYVGLL
jgi:hypothetical protein